jgi:hypothetical protein
MARLNLLALITLTAALGGQALAAPIVMTRGTISSHSRDGVDGREQVFSYANFLPFYEEVTARAGDTVTTTIRDWQVAPDDTTTLGFGFEHTRGGDFGSFTDATGVQFTFIAQQTAWYSLDGFFALAGDEFIEFDVDFVNMTTGTTLFSNLQRSENTRDARFALGETRGDLANTLTGSLSGMLFAGSEYSLSYRALLNTRVDDAGASGDGGLWLTIGTTPVPAPSTLLLLLLPGLTWVARRAPGRPPARAKHR